MKESLTFTLNLIFHLLKDFLLCVRRGVEISHPWLLFSTDCLFPRELSLTSTLVWISLPHDLISLCCLWQAIIYFYLLSRWFWSWLRQIHALLNTWLISTGIWPNEHNLGRLWQLLLTFLQHVLHTLWFDVTWTLCSPERTLAQAINLPAY